MTLDSDPATEDRLSSPRSGLFRSDRAWRVPDYEERNHVAFRHWNPPVGV